jgi:putative nucleotidyltransferase with HDIG domain
MTRRPRPPGLLARTVSVTFVTTTVLLVLIFLTVMMSVRRQVRSTAQAALESSQRTFAAIQQREQRSLRLQAANVAESPTLKAAVDTYAAESRTRDGAVRAQLLNTVREELANVADRVEADALVVVDGAQKTLAAVGPFAAAWRPGETIALVTARSEGPSPDAIAHIGGATFRVIPVPLLLGDDVQVGSLYLATSLDRRFTDDLGELAHAQIAMVTAGRLTTSTLPAADERELDRVLPNGAVAGTLDLQGSAHAYRQLFAVGDTVFYALTSIDDAARTALRATTSTLLLIAAGALALALGGSIWSAHRLSRPIERLSSSLERMAASHQFDGRLPLTGISRELDTLTETFNALMASVAAAEAETQAAYTSAIRALAATLDARDPYTAGHSERVSVLSVAIGRSLALPAEDLEVLRLGALLHDIGKIGVPDDVLRKPSALTPAEYETIKLHPALGARILRTVPFLSPHIAIVELHHERPDGNGYPHGLMGDDIPLAARIVHVADAYDAMTSARAYRPGRPSHEALSELWRASGTEFHAEIVEALAAALPVATTASRDLAAAVEVCVA